MAVPGRTIKVSSVVAVLCIVIYIAAITIGAIQIISDIGERKNRAEREFQDLADRATSSAVFLGFMSEAYRETIRDFLTASDTLLGIIITGSGGEYDFERYPGSGIVRVGTSPRFKTGFGYPSMHPYMNLVIEGQRNVTIQAIYSYIDNAYFLRVLRNSLLAVLVALAIAFITLLIELSTRNKSVYAEAQPQQAPAPKPVPKPVQEKVIKKAEEVKKTVEVKKAEVRVNTAAQTGLPDDPFQDISFPRPEPAEPEPTSMASEDFFSLPEEEIVPSDPPYIDFSDTDLSGMDFNETEPSGGGNSGTEHASAVISDEGKREENNDEGPQGLYTSRSNVGWESYTLDRLSSEIHRCASIEHDLVFLMMEFLIKEELSDSLYRQFADEAVSFFAMRDLIFEKGSKGLSVIIPTSDLDQGMNKAEEFKNRVSGKLPDSFAGRTGLRIGLSSRSGRLVEAERLILEASCALGKAMADPVSPIIAFRSDPEKYREYLKGRTNN